MFRLALVGFFLRCGRKRICVCVSLVGLGRLVTFFGVACPGMFSVFFCLPVFLECDFRFPVVYKMLFILSFIVARGAFVGFVCVWQELFLLNLVCSLAYC